MIEIPLTRGKVALIDAGDLPLISKHTWFAGPDGPRHVCYAYTTVARQTVLMHCLIMGTRPGHEIDHANRNGLDNRRENLRFATKSQNQANSRKRVGASGYRGVEISTRMKTRPFRASISIGGKRIHGGYHSDAITAALEYDRLAAQHYGEFAWLNFPPATSTSSVSSGGE